MKEHSSRAGPGAMITKTESSEYGAISFLQELRSLFTTTKCSLSSSTLRRSSIKFSHVNSQLASARKALLRSPSQLESVGVN